MNAARFCPLWALGWVAACLGPTVPDEVASQLFLSIASRLPREEVEQVAMPTSDTVDALIEQLTHAERERFAQMLRTGIGN